MSLNVNRFFIFLVAFATITPYSKIFFNLSLLNFIVLSNIIYIFFNWGSYSKKIIDRNALCIIFLLHFIIIIDFFTPQVDIGRRFFWSLGLLILFLSIFSSYNSLIRFAKYYLYLISLSSLVGLCQIMNFDWAWDLRFFFGVPGDDLVLNQLLERKKSVGLAYYSVQYAYQCLVAGGFLFFIYPPYSFRQFIFGIFIILGLITTGSLSVLLIVIIFFLHCYWGVVKKYRILFLLSVMLLISTTPIGARIFYLHQDSGLISRLYLNYIGISMLPDLPFFGYSFHEINEAKIRLIDNHGASAWIADVAFHNSFLTTILENGMLMLIFYVVIFLLVLKLSLVIAKSSCLNEVCIDDVNHGDMYKIFALLVPAYILMSSLHNAGIQTGDIYGWIIIAFVISFYRKIRKF